MSLEIINCDPEIWGKHLWYSMEAIACTLNKSNQKEIQVFFESLTNVIPCQTCRNHFIHYYYYYPIRHYLTNSLTLLEWLYNLKCQIKKRQNREIPTFSEYFIHIVEYYNVYELYELVESKINSHTE
jgi:hypothetical protein